MQYVAYMEINSSYVAGFTARRGYVTGSGQYVIQLSGLESKALLETIGARYGLPVSMLGYRRKKGQKARKAYRLVFRGPSLRRLILDCRPFWDDDDRSRFGELAWGGTAHDELMGWMGDEEVTTREIAEHLGIDRSSAHRKMTRLKDKGLVDSRMGKMGANVWHRLSSR